MAIEPYLCSDRRAALGGDSAALLQRQYEIGGNLGGDLVRLGQTVGVGGARVFQSEDVEVQRVALVEVVERKTAEAFGPDPLAALVLALVAFDEMG